MAKDRDRTPSEKDSYDSLPPGATPMDLILRGIWDPREYDEEIKPIYVTYTGTFDEFVEEYGTVLRDREGYVREIADDDVKFQMGGRLAELLEPGAIGIFGDNLYLQQKGDRSQERNQWYLTDPPRELIWLNRAKVIFLRWWANPVSEDEIYEKILAEEV